MKNLLRLSILVFSICLYNNTYAQISDNGQDTTSRFLVNKCFELFEPHSELTYSFGTDELKKESPNLSPEIHQLKDTTKILDELKGNYKDWYTFYRIGNLYKRFNQEQNAMNYFNQAYNLIYNEIVKDSLKAAPFADMGSLYLNLNSNENAFYFFKRAYALDEKDSTTSMFLPMFYIFSGDLKEAENLVRKRLSYDPQNTEMYIWLITSKIYQSLGLIDKNDKSALDKTIDELFDLKDINAAALKYKNNQQFVLLEQLSRLLALFAKSSALSDNFEKVNISSNDLKELKNIQKNLQKFLDKKQYKNTYIIYKSMGFCYLLEKNTDKASEYFRKAINVWPKDKNAKDYYILFTTQFFLKKDTLAALKIIEEKIKNDSEINMVNANDYVLKGNVLLQKRDFAGAKEAYLNALQFQQIPDAFLGLSLFEIFENKLADANQYINKAYDLNKDNYLTYTLFGIITILNNQKDASKDAFEKAKQLKPDDKTVKEIYEAFFPK